MKSANFSIKNKLSSISPFIQGEMDGLCGLYAIANAVRFIYGNKINPKQYRTIFETKNLNEIFHHGMEDCEIEKHLARCSKIIDFRYNVFSNNKNIPNIPDSQTSCFIISVDKSDILWDEPHYTVLVGNTPTHYTFYDCVYGHFRVPRELFSFKPEKNKIRIFQKNMYLIY